MDEEQRKMLARLFAFVLVMHAAEVIVTANYKYGIVFCPIHGWEVKR